MLRNEPTPEADGYGVGSASRLKLCEQVPDVGLDGFLGEEQPFTDLPVDEPVRDELEDLDLPRSGVGADLTRGGRTEGNDRSVSPRAPTRGSRLEAAAVIAIPVQDLLTLRGVHVCGIGAVSATL